MILKHRDKELLRFEWIEPQGVRIVSVDEGNNRYLPLDFKGEVSDENLWKWLSRRVVPRNRRNIDALMAATGLEARNVRGIIEICRGLSLNLARLPYSIMGTDYFRWHFIVLAIGLTSFRIWPNMFHG